MSLSGDTGDPPVTRFVQQSPTETEKRRVGGAGALTRDLFKMGADYQFIGAYLEPRFSPGAKINLGAIGPQILRSAAF